MLWLRLPNISNSKPSSQFFHIRPGCRNEEHVIGDAGFSVTNSQHEVSAELTVQSAQELSDRLNVGKPSEKFGAGFW